MSHCEQGGVVGHTGDNINCSHVGPYVTKSSLSLCARCYFCSSDVFGVSDVITESKDLVSVSTGISLNSNSVMNNNLSINSCLMWLIR